MVVIPWDLTGTDNQRRISREAFDKIKFPFERLILLPGRPELGWTDLNNSSMSMNSGETASTRRHEGKAHRDPKQDLPDPLMGEINGRHWVMGVIYPLSGRIYLDVRLENDPEMAATVVAAEIAHAVDFFLPMTDSMRNELLRLWNKPGTTWWEKFDYGSEYFTLGGEAFMHEFVAAYTDLDFGNKTPFTHDAGVEPEDVCRILGIARTDAVVEEPVPVPVPPVPPVPLPSDNGHTHTYVRLGKSKVVHKPTHYDETPRKNMHVFEAETIPEGLRSCKVCKPHG